MSKLHRSVRPCPRCQDLEREIAGLRKTVASLQREKRAMLVVAQNLQARLEEIAEAVHQRSHPVAP